MSINIQECSNIEINILELNISILKHYLNDKQYNELDKIFFISNIIKNLNLEQLCSEYDFFKDKEHNFLLDKIYDLTKFKISFRSFFKKPDKFKELAQVINIINQKYDVDTISLFEIILLSYNISKTETSKLSIKTFKDELITLNKNNTITINDFFKKMYIDFYMYSYLCGNYNVNNEIIKEVNNLIPKYYSENKIIQKSNLSKINILIEPYAVSSIISIKIINFMLYQLYKYNLLDIFLSHINTFQTIFKTKFLEFLNDRSIEINIARIKKLDSEEFAKYLKDKHDENKLLYIDHHEIILSFFLNSDERIIEYKELLSSGTYQLNKLIYYNTIDNFIKVNIVKLALILIIYNYYYGNIIKENFIDTYINYIKYMGDYILINFSDYEKNNKYGQYLKKNFKVLNIEFKQKSQSKKLSPIIELPLNTEKEELETSKVRVKLGKTLSNEEEIKQTKKLLLELEKTKNIDKKLLESIPTPKKRHLTKSLDSYNKKSSLKTTSLNNKKSLTDSFKKELEEIKQIEKILNILKNTDSIDDYNKYLNELIQILKFANEKINKRYKEKLDNIIYILNLYNSIKTIKFKDTLEIFKRYLTRNNLTDNLLLKKIINDVELNLKDKSALFKLSVEELKKEIIRHDLDKKKIKELEDIIKDKELLVKISSPKERHQTKSLDSYNKKSSLKTTSLNSKKPLVNSLKKELEEIEKILNILKNTDSIDDYNKYLDELKKILDLLKIRDLELYKKYNIQLQQINKIILYYNKLNNISTKEELEELKKELKLNEIYNVKLIETKYNELSEYIDLVTKILKDKLYRLVHYTRLKINNLSIIYESYEKTFKELKYLTEITSVKNNSKKISDLLNFMFEYNKKYNINYYNYGSEASLLLLLKPNVTLEEIRDYVNEYKSEYKNIHIALNKKYSLRDYLNKIGYDLAICQYVFTNISFIFSKEHFNEIIDIILRDAYNTIDKYIDEVDNYYSKIMNLESISKSNIKKQTKKEQVEKIFNDDLYKEEKEQLKYNLYKYKYKQFPSKPTVVLLWFINNVVLRFSDI